MSEAGDRSLFQVLTVGATVIGLAGGTPTKIIAVERLTDESANVAFRTEGGGIEEKIVFADMLPHLKEVRAGSAFSFDASPDAFLLAAEARRMRLAHLFDPLAALGTQRCAAAPAPAARRVRDMLEKQPLRFVLADDPGAGKTVMAGLLVKELSFVVTRRTSWSFHPASSPISGTRRCARSSGSSSRCSPLTRSTMRATRSRGRLWLARLDVLARNSEGILDKACEVDWDLIIFDEAHKMSASVWGSEVKKTKRYQMAEDWEAHAQPPVDDGDPALGEGGAVPAVHGATRL